MSGIPFQVSADSAHPATVKLSTYFKVAVGVSEGTALLALESATSTRLFAFIDATGLVTVLGTYRGVDVIVPLNAAHLVQPGQWYWLTMRMGPGGNVPDSNRIYVVGQLWSETGLTSGPQEATGVPTSTPSGGWPDSLNWPFGWGCALTEAVANFANSVGNELACCVVESNVAPLAIDQPSLIQPITDPTAASLQTLVGYPTAKAIYLCHEPIGSSDVIHDSSGNGYDLSPGPHGFVVVADGPY